METGILADYRSWLFAILVPHRDCLPALDTYRQSLFSAGMDGAFSFPAAAPLALLHRPLSKAELKNAATELRKQLGEKPFVCIEQGEKTVCREKQNNAAEKNGSADTLCFFGPILELPLPRFPDDAVVQHWETPILAPAILAPGDKLPDPLPQAMAVSFRAAALANLSYTRVLSGKEAGATENFEPEYSFSWELGPLQWLPRRI